MALGSLSTLMEKATILGSTAALRGGDGASPGEIPQKQLKFPSTRARQQAERCGFGRKRHLPPKDREGIGEY
jgi:hypothetical protein